MQELAARRLPLDPREYTMRHAQADDCEILVDEPTIVTEHGRVRIVYDRVDKYDYDLHPLVQLLQRTKFATARRSTGLLSTSKVFGFEPRRTLRRDYCHTSGWGWDEPDDHETICGYAHLCEEVYRQHHPAGYGHHVDVVAQGPQRVRDIWRMHGTIFTSGIANKNNPLPYHFDQGNFEGVWSAMLCLRNGIEGGHLAVPQFNLNLACQHGYIVLFDGQGLLHGVTPIIRDEGNPDHWRYTVVYYSLKQMWKCVTPGEELERIKRVKTDREQRRAGLIP